MIIQQINAEKFLKVAFTFKIFRCNYEKLTKRTKSAVLIATVVAVISAGLFQILQWRQWRLL
jgi:hypothetical protein